MVGRAYLYGLGAAGERGVDHVLQMFDADVRRVMALIGAHDIAALTPELRVGPDPALTRLNGRAGSRRRRCTAGR